MHAFTILFVYTLVHAFTILLFILLYTHLQYFCSYSRTRIYNTFVHTPIIRIINTFVHTLIHTFTILLFILSYTHLQYFVHSPITRIYNTFVHTLLDAFTILFVYTLVHAFTILLFMLPCTHFVLQEALSVQSLVPAQYCAGFQQQLQGALHQTTAGAHSPSGAPEHGQHLLDQLCPANILQPAPLPVSPLAVHSYHFLGMLVASCCASYHFLGMLVASCCASYHFLGMLVASCCAFLSLSWHASSLLLCILITFLAC